MGASADAQTPDKPLTGRHALISPLSLSPIQRSPPKDGTPPFANANAGLMRRANGMSMLPLVILILFHPSSFVAIWPLPA